MDDDLTPAEKTIRDEAIAYARANKKRIAGDAASVSFHPSESDPVAVFMAGSPGAGKTEASKELLASFKEQNGSQVLRIDPDELRERFPAYDRTNAYLFQGAVSILVGRILDLAYEQNQSFLLDGTLSHIEVAIKNVKRALSHGRTVQILYVYLDPCQAWNFVEAREATEGRRIPVATFIDQYFAARDVVNTLKREFGAKIAVDLLLKPIDGTERLYRAGIDQIDSHVPEKYDRSSLEILLCAAKP